MELRQSEEQVLLQDMVRRFLVDLGAPGSMGRAPIAPAAWQALAELGLLGFLLPERAGGMGGGVQDAMIVAEELGRGLAVTPLAESVLLCADLIARHGSAAQIDLWVRPIMDGHSLMAFAIGDALTARPQDGGWRVDGIAPFVRDGATADALLIIARHGGQTLLLAAQADASGIERTPFRLADATDAAQLRFEGVALGPDAAVGLPDGTLDAAIARAQIAILAEMIGIMTMLHEATLDYIRQRHQFGVPIASFQVIQHRAARMFISLEQSRSLLLKAALAQGDETIATMGAKAYIADAALRLAQDATQLHGGIGVMEELPVGRGHRRILVLARLFGDAATARADYAAASLAALSRSVV